MTSRSTRYCPHFPHFGQSSRSIRSLPIRSPSMIAPSRGMRASVQACFELHGFGLGRSLRISLNSFGPLRSRRFLVCRSSSVADGSPNSSICWPARSDAFDTTFRLSRGVGWDPASPSSTRRRMASDRVSVPLRFDHSSIRVIISRDNRMPINGSRPVAGLPRFFGFIAIDFTIITVLH